MQKIRKTIRLYVHHMSLLVKLTNINIRCAMQYKTSFFLSVIGQVLATFQAFLAIFFMFRRFSDIKGFTYSEVLLCFSIILFEFSLAEMFARGFDSFSGIVRNGEFDRILVRPQNTVIQVLGSKFELTRIGRITQAVVTFVYGILASEIEWNFSKVITILFMLIGGTVVFTSLFLIYAALCFFTLDGLEFMNAFTDGAREFGAYPLGIYGRKMLLFTTFVIPYSLVQYYPLLYILGQRTSLFYMVLPLFSCWFFIPALMLWKLGVRHYKSSGS